MCRNPPGVEKRQLPRDASQPQEEEKKEGRAEEHIAQAVPSGSSATGDTASGGLSGSVVSTEHDFDRILAQVSFPASLLFLLFFSLAHWVLCLCREPEDAADGGGKAPRKASVAAG